MSILIVQPRGEEKPSHLRQKGIIPLGLVESGKPTRKIQATQVDLKSALSHAKGAGMLELKVEGESKKHMVFVKQVDYKPTTRTILAANFTVVEKGDTILSDVAIHAVGEPVPVTDNLAMLDHPTTSIKLKGEPQNMPASLEVDVSGLEIGDRIHASDLKLPEKTELMSSPEATLFSVQVLRAAEPEVQESTESTEPAPE